MSYSMDFVRGAYAYSLMKGLVHDAYIIEYRCMSVFGTAKARRNEGGGQADAATCLG
jgi:hypothetical protein